MIQDVIKYNLVYYYYLVTRTHSECSLILRKQVADVRDLHVFPIAIIAA